MITPDTGSRATGNIPVAVMAPPPGRAPDGNQPGRRFADPGRAWPASRVRFSCSD
jgi:hypothetical protein